MKEINLIGDNWGAWGLVGFSLLLLLLLLLTFLVSCENKKIIREAEKRKIEYPQERVNNRITGGDRVNVGGYYYQIISVDGHEYLSSSYGGLCPLVNQKAF